MSEAPSATKNSNKKNKTMDGQDTTHLFYPFVATQSHVKNEMRGVWRYRQHHRQEQDFDVSYMPASIKEARQIRASSLQKSLAIRFLINEMAVSSASGARLNTYHLGGLPGAGKTAAVTSLIAELIGSRLVGERRLLLCCKLNAAKENLMTTSLEMGNFSKLEMEEMVGGEKAFVTINRGFSIPVIKTALDGDEDNIKRCAYSLKCRILYEMLGALEMIIIDEYTMTNIRDMVFIDAIMRIIRCRPDIPFGGTYVIFLGDNRQNTAVIGTDHDVVVTDDGNTSENYTPPSAAAATKNLYSQILLDIIQSVFLTSSGVSLKVHEFQTIIEDRLASLHERKAQVTNHINDLLATYERIKEEGNRLNGCTTTEPPKKKIKKDKTCGF